MEFREATDSMWIELYELTDKIKQLKPWEIFQEFDVLTVQLDDKTTLFNTFDGNAIVTYVSEKGLKDYYSLQELEVTQFNPEWQYFEANFLAAYFDEPGQIPLWQQDVNNRLKLHSSNYYVSNVKAKIPWKLNKLEVSLLIKNYEKIITALVNTKMNKLEFDYHNKTCVLHYLDQSSNSWQTIVSNLPEKRHVYPTVNYHDQELLEKMTNKPQNSETIIMDYKYLGVITEDFEDRPNNPRLLFATNENCSEVFTAAILKSTDIETVGPVNFLSQYIMDMGAPKAIKLNNPYIEAAIFNICKYHNIEIIIDPLEETIPFVQGLMKQLLQPVSKEVN